MIRRREFITLLGGAAAAWPLVARAQPQTSLPLVGLLEGAEDPILPTAIRLGLSQSGFVEGKSVTFEYRNANGKYDRLPALAAELVRRQVAVIGTVSPVAALAAKAASISRSLVARTTTSCSPRVRAAVSVSFNSNPAFELLGFKRIAMTGAMGTVLCRSSSFLAASRLLKKVTPVTLPPGRFRLATSPS